LRALAAARLRLHDLVDHVEVTGIVVTVVTFIAVGINLPASRASSAPVKRAAPGRMGSHADKRIED
jgi:hypothetical protein